MNPLIMKLLEKFAFAKDVAVVEDSIVTKPGETMMQAADRVGVVDAGSLKSLNKTFNNKDKSEPQVIKTAGDPEVVPNEVRQAINAMERLRYVVRKDDTKNYNLNIVGIRNTEVKENRFNDQLWVFWRFENRWNLKQYKITANPGLFWLNNPAKAAGTAILKEGQYPDSHIFGKHKSYDALKQHGSVTVIRDANKDNQLDFDSGKTQTGVFGINIHRANAVRESQYVDKWSAGCQVFANPQEFQDFLRLCRLCMDEWGNSFTYTLFRKDQLKT